MIPVAAVLIVGDEYQYIGIKRLFCTLSRDKQLAATTLSETGLRRK